VILAGFERVAYASADGVNGGLFEGTWGVVREGGWTTEAGLIRPGLQSVRVGAPLKGDVYPYFSAPVGGESPRNANTKGSISAFTAALSTNHRMARTTRFLRSSVSSIASSS
jgi:hypothetical protein